VKNPNNSKRNMAEGVGFEKSLPIDRQPFTETRILNAYSFLKTIFRLKDKNTYSFLFYKKVWVLWVLWSQALIIKVLRCTHKNKYGCYGHSMGVR